MEAYEVSWGREDDLSGYYPKDKPSDDYAMPTPWRVRKLIGQGGKIEGWSVAMREDAPEGVEGDGGWVYRDVALHERVREAKADAAARIADEYNAEREARRAEWEAKAAAERKVAEPMLAAIRSWIADNQEAIEEAGVTVALDIDTDEHDPATVTADDLNWRNSHSQTVDITWSDDHYRNGCYVRVYHPHSTRYDYDAEVDEPRDCVISHTGDPDTPEEAIGEAKCLLQAASLAAYLNDVAAMVREQNPVAVSDED